MTGQDFKVKTTKAEYSCTWSKEQGKWTISIENHKKNISGDIYLQENAARTRVMQVIESLDEAL